MRALATALVLASLVPAPARASSDSSIRCRGGIVSVGDATIDLLGKCGEPAMREGRTDLTTVAYRAEGDRVKQASAVNVERWTYDFGPRAFLMFVTVEGGKVTLIERGGYGYTTPNAEPPPVPLRRARCEPNALHVGDAKIDVLNRCGEPTLAERRDQLRTVSHLVNGVIHERSVSVVAEVWTYDFGPQTLVRFVLLEEGVVTRIDSGGYGYTR
jgi:hypothetical protein